MNTGRPPDSGTATFDPLGRYRYRLTRAWDRTGPAITWIMLNPSTADAAVDDPTIRRVVGFSRAWGFGRLLVVNLFALRATRPQDLSDSPAPVGPGNDDAISEAVSAADGLLVAWGNHGVISNPGTGVCRDREVLHALAGASKGVGCLGTTNEGQPRHPLYRPALSAPVVFRPGAPTTGHDHGPTPAAR